MIYYNTFRIIMIQATIMLTLLLTSVLSEYDKTWFKTFPDQFIERDDLVNLTSVSAHSSGHCAMMCRVREECDFAEFNIPTKTCLLQDYQGQCGFESGVLAQRAGSVGLIPKTYGKYIITCYLGYF